MRLFTSLTLALSLVLSFIPSSLGHAHQGRRHHVHRRSDLAHRDPGEIELFKRFDNSRFTYYAVGLGACGQTNQPGDFIVALNSAQYNGGQYCFQMITITANGKTAQAQIMDECPGCPYAGLDFSQGLFEYFADVSVGVLYGSWDFGSGGSVPSPSPSPSPPPPPPPPPPPSPTSVNIPLTSLLPTPSTTSSPPPPSTSSVPPTSTLSSSSSASANSTSTTPTQTATNPVAVSAGAMPGGTNSSTLLDLNLFMVYVGSFVSSSQ